MSKILEELYSILQDRINNSDAKKSYTKSLVDSGIEKITRKIMEEAFEVSLAAIDGNNHKNGKEQIIEESADLIYHLLVLLASKNINIKKVLSLLESRNSANFHII